MTDDPSLQAAAPIMAARKPLTPAAARALAEAEARRKAAEANADSSPNNESSLNKQPSLKEINGPQGPEPTRYGDWERKGIASDF